MPKRKEMRMKCREENAKREARLENIIIKGPSGIATVGKFSTAAAGQFGKATAGDFGRAIVTSNGVAIAGRGGIAEGLMFASAAVTGDYGRSTAKVIGKALSGEYGTSIVEDQEGEAIAGAYGTAIAGNGSYAAAGVGGVIQIWYWDPSAQRQRVKVGYVGEGGIESDTFYQVKDGEFIKRECPPSWLMRKLLQARKQK